MRVRGRRTDALLRQQGGIWRFLSSIGVNGANISGGSGLQLGDLAILNDAPVGTSTPVTQFVPSGWTQIGPFVTSDGTDVVGVSYKVLTSADITAGALNTTTGMVGQNTSRKLIFFFRASSFSSRLLGLTPVDTGSTIAAATLTQESKMGAVPAGRPGIEIGCFRTNAGTEPWTVPAGATVINGTSTGHRMSYRIFPPGYKPYGTFEIVAPSSFGMQLAFGLWSIP